MDQAGQPSELTAANSMVQSSQYSHFVRLRKSDYVVKMWHEATEMFRPNSFLDLWSYVVA